MSKLYISGETDARKTTLTARAHSNADVHLRGWDCGVHVYANIPKDSDRPEFTIFVTGGSNKPSGRIVMTIRQGLDGTPEIEAVQS